MHRSKLSEQDYSRTGNDPKNWPMGLLEIQKTVQERKLVSGWIDYRMAEIFVIYPLDGVAVVSIIYKELQN